MAGQLECDVQPLLHEKNGRPPFADALERLDQRLDDDGRKPLGRLVDDHEARARGQRARDGQHLLLAARQVSAPSVEDFGEGGKVLEDLVPLAVAAAGPPAPQSAEPQVLRDGQVGDDPAVLRNVGDAHAGHRIAGKSDDALAEQGDGAGPDLDDAHDALQGGRLAGSVAAEQRHHRALLHPQIDAVQDVRLAVVAVDAVDDEHH